MMSDRAIGIWGFILGLVGFVLALVSLWFSVVASPWGTRNDYFCYRTEWGVSCYYTRANCETEQQREKAKVIRECEREEAPFRRSS
jgi:hypothetical protein